MYEAAEPVYIYDANANENYYLLKNDQNTVLALYQASDTTGSVPREQYEYSSYGITNILDQNGLVKTFDHDLNVNTPEVKKVKSDFSNPFGYHGMWRDEHTGLYHTHYRLYDPQHVRWLTPDPAGYRDGQNLYRFYAGPNGVDPLGLNISDDECRLLSMTYHLIKRAIFKGELDKAADLYSHLVEQFNEFNNDSFLSEILESGNNTNYWATMIKCDLENIGKFTGIDESIFNLGIKVVENGICEKDAMSEWGRMSEGRFEGIIETGYIENICFMGGPKLFFSGGKFVFNSAAKTITFSCALKAEVTLATKNFALKKLMLSPESMRALNVLMVDGAGLGGKSLIGMTDDAIAFALKSERLDHAFKHFWSILPGTAQSKVAREAGKDLIGDILKSPLKVFDYNLQGTATKAFYKIIDGKDLVVFVAKDNTGKVLANQVLGSRVVGETDVVLKTLIGK